jgi:NAD(P)-dependent dehydrogenase (short-subunit alcohol dehydrogenase family)
MMSGSDILVNNAGIGTAVPALRQTPEEFRGVIEVNLLGAFWMAQASPTRLARRRSSEHHGHNRRGTDTALVCPH